MFSNPFETLEINLRQRKFDVLLGGWTELKLSETFRGNDLTFSLNKIDTADQRISNVQRADLALTEWVYSSTEASKMARSTSGTIDTVKSAQTYLKLLRN